MKSLLGCCISILGKLSWRMNMNCCPERRLSGALVQSVVSSASIWQSSTGSPQSWRERGGDDESLSAGKWCILGTRRLRQRQCACSQLFENTVAERDFSIGLYYSKEQPPSQCWLSNEGQLCNVKQPLCTCLTFSEYFTVKTNLNWGNCWDRIPQAVFHTEDLLFC